MKSTFVFTGDPLQGTDRRKRETPDQRESITAFGITFPRGEEVVVEDATAISKLRGNSHFTEVVASQAKKPAAKPAQAKKPAGDESGEQE